MSRRALAVMLPALAVAVAVAVAVGLAGARVPVAAATTSAGDAALQASLSRSLPRLASALRVLDAPDPAPGDVQRAYDIARDVEDELQRPRRLSAGCRPLYRHALAYASALVRAAEGHDRLSPTQVAGALESAARAEEWISRQPARCSRGEPMLVQLRPAVASTLPSLPPSAARHVRAGARDGRLEGRLAKLVDGFDGYAAVWMQDLSSGRVAGANEHAAFPAASTVKLGVLVAALRRFGPDPLGSRARHELEAITGWSSNLAANRLVRQLGKGSSARGAAVVEATLRRLGTTASTYPGDYVVATSVSATGSANAEPPRSSQRTTSARDLGQILFVIHAAAMGDRLAQRRAGLTRREAEAGLALLLRSRPIGDNAGLVRPWLQPRVPVAQKNGWIRSARLTASIVYTRARPILLVVLVDRQGLTRSDALALARQVARATLPGSALR